MQLNHDGKPTHLKKLKKCELKINLKFRTSFLEGDDKACFTNKKSFNKCY